MTSQEIEAWKQKFINENVRSQRTAMAFEFIDRLVAENCLLRERIESIIADGRS